MVNHGQNLEEISSSSKAIMQVHISKSRRTFKKGYLPSWTQEIFTVTKIILRVPPVYQLRDYADDEIEGVFYAEELQKVHKSDDI